MKENIITNTLANIENEQKDEQKDTQKIAPADPTETLHLTQHPTILRYKGNEKKKTTKNKYAPTITSLNTALLSLNTPYTYKQLTSLLQQPSLTSTSKSRQLLEFSRFFEYEKVGTKYIITNIYTPPLPYLPVQQKDGKYTAEVIAILLTYLYNKAEPVFYLTHMDFILICGLANERFKQYKDEYKELKKELSISEEINIPLPQISDFFSTAYKYFRNIISSALSSMEGRCMLKYVETYIIYKQLSPNIPYSEYKGCEATNEEVIEILEMQHEALKVLGLKTLQELWYKPNYKQKYYDEVERIMYKKKGDYWKGFYKTVKIFSSPTILYNEVNVDEKKKELNKKVFTVMHNAAVKKYAEMKLGINKEKIADGWLKNEEVLEGVLIKLMQSEEEEVKGV